MSKSRTCQKRTFEYKSIIYVQKTKQTVILPAKINMPKQMVTLQLCPQPLIILVLAVL